MTLDPKIRLRFQNNAADMLNFLNNPENRAEAEQLGLLNPKIVNPVSNQESPQPAASQK